MVNRSKALLNLQTVCIYIYIYIYSAIGLQIILLTLLVYFSTCQHFNPVHLSIHTLVVSSMPIGDGVDVVRVAEILSFAMHPPSSTSILWNKNVHSDGVLGCWLLGGLTSKLKV